MNKLFGQSEGINMPPNIKRTNPVENKDNASIIFVEAAHDLEKILGFNLSSIEIDGLKKITESVVEEAEVEVGRMSRINNYHLEIYERFFYDYFNIRYSDFVNENGELDESKREFLGKEYERILKRREVIERLQQKKDSDTTLLIYREVLKDLKSLVGSKFNLTNLELSGLKAITERVLEEASVKVGHMSRIGNYHTEILERFFLNYYNMRYEDLLNSKDRFDAPTREYLKEEQKKNHPLM